MANPSGVTKFIYDYFVKDHLGNVRSSVTAEPVTADYLARHEIATANVEQLVFDNIPNVRDTKPDGDGMAARLDGAIPNRRVGTAIMLKVMPGDRFNISADAYYEGEYQQSDVTGGQAIVESLMGALLNGNTYANVPVSELPDNVKIITQTLGNPSLAGQLESLMDAQNDPNAPKAHLNVLFFDDKMRLVPGGSSITQVPVVPSGGSLSGFVTLTPNLQGGTTTCCASLGSGWVIVFVDNQSIGKDVWFDNIMIEHYTGKVQEETHYYPFGLALQTSEESSHKEQPYKYQGVELEKHFGLETYETFYRGLDPQIGRFNQIDPKPTYWISPYASMNNNPVIYTDMLGDSVDVSGLYQKNADGSFVNRDAVLAFELFASTDNGRAYLLERAQKGFKLKGEIICDLEIEATEEGTVSKGGVDVVFTLGEVQIGGGAATSSELTKGVFGKKDGGRLKTTFTYPEVFKVFYEDDHQQTMYNVDKMTHEPFLHGMLNEKKYFSNVNKYSFGRGDHYESTYRDSYHEKNAIPTLKDVQEILIKRNGGSGTRISDVELKRRTDAGRGK